jgi:AcrR family transcriptional regulator
MVDNPQPMDVERKPMRIDAERNRRRLIAAATKMFGERGLDVGVGEIAESAGVGRGTLFRNFPTKEHLIAAIVVERMGELARHGRDRLADEDPGEALFALLQESVGPAQQTDRALFEALDDEWMENDDIRAGHAELMVVLDALVARAQAAGAIRADVGAIDVLCMTKGVCEASRHFEHLNPGIAARQFDLVRAALTDTSNRWPVRGGTPADPVPGGRLPEPLSS